MKKVHLIPLVGLVAAVAEHWKACEVHQQNATQENFNKTWEAFDDCHVALISFLAPFVITTMIVLALHAPWPWK